MADAALVEHLFATAAALPVIAIRDGRITRCSQSACDLLPARPGLRFEELFDARSQVKLVAALGARPSSCELQAHLNDSELVLVRLSFVPQPDGEYLVFVTEAGVRHGEQFSSRLLAGNDHLANITRTVALKSAELDAARARFETLAEQREQFISMLAHDVRSALHSVVLNAKVLELTGTEDKIQTQALERIRNSSSHAVELVAKVLAIARTESGRIALDLKSVSLRTLVREIVQIYEPIAAGGGTRLHVNDLGDDPEVAADRVQIGRVLGNVIENALRHTGGTVTIDVGGRTEVARIAVRDGGEAIPPELREHIFERFVQGANKKGSLGLGLYIARGVIEQHQGRIFIEDDARGGTAIVIELPLSPV